MLAFPFGASLIKKNQLPKSLTEEPNYHIRMHLKDLDTIGAGN